MDPYIIVFAQTPTGLQTNVNASLSKGYEPLGGITVIGNFFMQAMLARPVTTTILPPATSDISGLAFAPKFDPEPQSFQTLLEGKEVTFIRHPTQNIHGTKKASKAKPGPKPKAK